MTTRKVLSLPVLWCSRNEKKKKTAAAAAAKKPMRQTEWEKVSLSTHIHSCNIREDGDDEAV